jgi:hypothetical protein
MISFLVDGVLAVALLVACLRMISVHRALEQLRAYHQDYQAAFEKTAVALAAVRAVLSNTNARGDELSTMLANLIEEARATIAEMDARMSTLDQGRSSAGEQSGGPLEKDEGERRVTAPDVAGTSHAPFAFCRRVGRPMVEAIADG